MKEELNSNQRRLLQIGIGLILVVFLIGYFFITHKLEEKVGLKNSTVYIQDSKLYAFDDIYSLEHYPDRIAMHYPYLLVVKPTEQITYIYNLEQKKKVKEVKEILLDYSDNKQLFTKGKTTFLNDEDLGVLCEKGFIKTTNEVLCLSKVNLNSVENKLISIDLATKKKKDIYISKNLISDLSVINGKTYLGEIDMYNHKNYIWIDGEKIGIPNIVSLIYEMNGKPYFAAFKSELNKNTETYYLIEEDRVIKQEQDKIYLYK